MILVDIFYLLLPGWIGKRTGDEQYSVNKSAWEEYTRKYGTGYIHDQSALGDMCYGKCGRLAQRLFFGGRPMTAARNACGAAAVYNALLHMGYYTPLPDILYELSENGIAAGGTFGTAPAAVRAYFERHGHAVRVLDGCRADRHRMRDAQQQSDTFIFVSFNCGYDPRSQLHFMCVTKDSRGDEEVFCVHNDNEGNRVSSSLWEAVRGYRCGESGLVALFTVLD